MISIMGAAWPSEGQWSLAINGMRNPMNSWDKGDSCIDWGNSEYEKDPSVCYRCSKQEWCSNPSEDDAGFIFGKADMRLAKNLIKAGPEHAKFLRQLPVILEIDAPLYWWKQMSTYAVGTTTNSQSTMHRLTADEFTLDDFSFDSLVWIWKGEENSNEAEKLAHEYLKITEKTLNALRDKYIETKDMKYWHAINEMLSQSYMQMRTWSGSYANLFNFCAQRPRHKLKEWAEIVCYVVHNAPFFAELCYDKLCEVNDEFRKLFEEDHDWKPAINTEIWS